MPAARPDGAYGWPASACTPGSRALVDARREVGARRAAEVVALLSEEPPREYGDDLAAAWRAARRGNDAYGARWRQEARRLASAAGGSGASVGSGGSGASGTTGAEAGAPGAGGDDAVAGVVAAFAFPERVARGRSGGTFLMASGTGAELGDGSRLRTAPWLAVAVADRPVHAASARVRLAAVIDEATAKLAAEHLLVSGEEVRWEGGDVVARRVERLGAVELTVRALAEPDPERVREALLDGLRREGLGLLRWTRDARGLRERLAFLHRVLGAPWPDVSDARSRTVPTRGWSRSCHGRAGGPTSAGSRRGRR